LIDLFQTSTDSDPFGTDSTPRKSIEQIKAEITDRKLAEATGEKQRQPRAQQVDHKARARKYFEKRGYIWCPCEYHDTLFIGRPFASMPSRGEVRSILGSVAQGELDIEAAAKRLEQPELLVRKHDLLGLFDAIAMHPNPATPGIIGVQLCSTGDAGAHARKMASPELDKKSGAARADGLRAWLASGNHALILMFERREKVGNQEWFPVENWVTEEVIAKIESRRRK
jgi:hypothetical protein